MLLTYLLTYLLTTYLLIYLLTYCNNISLTRRLSVFKFEGLMSFLQRVHKKPTISIASMRHQTATNALVYGTAILGKTASLRV